MFNGWPCRSRQTDTCMTTTAEHCIAAIGLNDYCHDIIIISLPARLYMSQLDGSCCVKPSLYFSWQWMAVLRMFIAPTATTTIGSDCPEIMWRHVIMKLAIQFGKVVSHPNTGRAIRSREPPSNFAFKLAMLPVETLSCFAVKTAWSY